MPMFRTLCLFACLGFATQLSAQDKSAELFKPQGPVIKIAINLDNENLNLIKREPRKYVRATFQGGDVRLEDVAIHVKGAAGSFRNWDDKPALTINFDKFKKDQRFSGLDKMHINNSVQDGSYFCEMVSAELFRRANVPVARCTHARVELNNRKAGLYVLKEGFDKTFLKRYFENNDGVLYDGGFLMDIDAPLKIDSGTSDRKDLQVLLKACQEGDPKKRWDALNKLVDIDRFVSLCVVEVLACDWDGYARNRNNYRLYHDPKSDKFTFFAHGKDQMFQNPGDGLWHGWQSHVGRAVLDHPEGKKKYIDRMKQLCERDFTTEAMFKVIDEALPRAKEAMEKIQPGAGKQFENEANALKERIKQRVEFVKRELPKLK
jgi:spore coat protein H